MVIYPIRFKPIIKEKIWGGTKLVHVLNKESENSNIGESWEISGIENSVSIVDNGTYKGESLVNLLKNYRKDFIGGFVSERFGNQFPLLFKFIDATDDLSIQLHPNDKIAHEKHSCKGKTEMWYILDSETNSKIYAGLKPEVSESEFIESLEDGSLVDIIRAENVDNGDAFFIDAGTIHAIGKGTLLAEIQQSSDITYRLYDWCRKDKKGNSRELHIDASKQAIDFSKNGSTKLIYRTKINCRNLIKKCEYFTVNNLSLTTNISLELKFIDSFVVYMIVQGGGEILINGYSESIRKGDSILIPAKAKEVFIKTEFIKILEIYIEDEI